MISRQLRGQVIDLVALINDGEATVDDRGRLQQLIAADEATQSFYVDYCHMVACLRWTLEHSPVITNVDEIATEFEPFLDGLEKVELASIPSSPPWKFSIRSRSWGSVAAIVAAALFWIVVGLLLMPRDIEHRNVALEKRERDLHAVPMTSGKAVASVVGAWDCRWTSASGKATPPAREGQRLAPDRVLELADGQVEMKFDDGATVLLQGPARFTVLSTKRGHLQVGRLGAVVPAVAKGFEIDTPSTLITDLGTEFSVDVNPSGVAEVQVIRGEVELTPKVGIEPAIRGASIRLAQNKAARVDSRAGAVQFLAPNPSRVVSRAGKVQISHRVGPQNSFLVSSTDLIDESGPSVMRTMSSVAKPREESDAKALNNGTIYHGVEPTVYAGPSALCPPDGMSVTYDLNLDECPAGYDILWIMSISGGGEGRRSQRFRVELSQVDSDEFSVLADEEQIHFIDNGAGEMHVRLERSDKQPLGREVDQIRFTFFDTPEASACSAYREIDVFGRGTRK